MLLTTLNNEDTKRLQEEADYLSIPGWRTPDEELLSRTISIVAEAGINRLEYESKKNSDLFYKYALYIPKQYARGEVREYPSKEDLESGKIPRYELYITDQVGSKQCRRNTYVYLRLPSGKIVPIILYTDYGVGFEPRDHKYVLRELDRLDRQIVLGFCRHNHSSLVSACHGDAEWHEHWLKGQARCYNSKKQPKRFKQGRESNLDSFYYNIAGGLAPYDT